MEERNLDTKSLIAFALMSLLLIVMFYFNADQQSVLEQALTAEKQVQQSSTENTLTSQETQIVSPPQQEVFSVLENDKIRLTITNKGGQISELEIKNQLTYKDAPVYLVKDNNASLSIELLSGDGRFISTKNIFFTPKLSGNNLILTYAGAKEHLEIVYNLPKDGHLVDVSLKGSGFSGDKQPTLHWKLKTRRMEKSVTYEDRYTQVIAHHNDGKLEKLSETSSDTEQIKEVKWIAFKQHLFSSFLISDKIQPSATISSTHLVKDESEEELFTKEFALTMPFEEQGGSFSEQLHFYFGGSDYTELKKYDDKYDLSEAIPLGWGIFGWINKWFIIPLFDFLTNYMSMGIAIIVLTIIVRILLSPVQYKSYLSQAKMKVLRPEIEEINNKYKDEPMKRQQETMNLYSKAGVNPLSGCVPALLQMPFFFALFSFFPTAFVFRHKNFLWAEDLASYDTVYQLPFSIPFYGDHISLFPILASVAMLVYMQMTTGQTEMPKQEGMPDMRFLMYLSPVMMLFFFNNYASGLSLYYFVSNLITIFIMVFIKYLIIDEQKIHARIQENKQKPKKEGKFQKQLREMMEQAQAQQEAANKKK